MIILLNHFEEQIGRLKRKDLSSAIQTEPINGIVKFEFTVEYGSNYKMDDVCFVGHRDAVDENSFQLYKIIYQAPTNEGVAYECVHIAHDDLKGYGYIREARLHEVQASVALYKALEGSRWEVGTVDGTVLAPIYFYDLSRLECISKILDTWNLEIAYRVKIVRNKVVKRYIDLHHKRGTDTGRRYVYGSNALEVVKEVNQSSIYTASIPRGRGEEKFDEEGESTGGFGRRIDIKDIEWSKAKGDPIDKPLGQEYIELPEMTEAFGYSDGTPRFKVNVYSNIEDPEQLIKVDYENLLKNSRPLVEFKANIEEFGEVELGDSVVIIRKDLDIFYKARVFSVKRNLLSGLTTDIQLGDNLSLTQADFNKAIRKDINNSNDELLDSVKSAVSFMQNALTESMYDDDAYWYFLDMDNEYDYPAGFYTFNKPIDSSPTKGVFIGGGKMAISNRKDSNGNMLWSTWATGDGLVADAITTGSFNADLIKTGTLMVDSGAIHFGSLENMSANISNTELSANIQGQETQFNANNPAFRFDYGIGAFTTTGNIDVWTASGKQSFHTNGLTINNGYGSFVQDLSAGCNLDSKGQLRITAATDIYLLGERVFANGYDLHKEITELKDKVAALEGDRKMKIDGINPQPLMDIINQSTGERGVVGYLLNIQTIKNNVFTGVVNAPVSVAEYEEYATNLHALAEKKITELYKLEISEVDRFDLEYYKKELEKEKAKTSSLENGLMELTLMYTNEVV